MADREMIAATLAAGILSAANSNGSEITPAEYAVTLYRQVLAGLSDVPVALLAAKPTEVLIQPSTRRRQT